MSFHSIFKKVVNESSLTTRHSDVNEAADDSAIGSLTRNNILPMIFSGDRNGLRVPSAMRSGKPAPYWGDEYRTYPFAGINGYANSPAIVAKQGNQASYMKDRLERIGNNPDIRSVLESQPNGIPADVFLMYPQMPISSVGIKGYKKSASSFTAYNTRDAYRRSLYPYNLQQALGVDANGKLFVDKDNPGGIVLSPKSRDASRNTKELMYAHKLEMSDICSLLGDNRRFATEFTGSDNLQFPRVGGLLKSYISGAPFDNPIHDGNPVYGDFNLFAHEMSADGYDFIGWGDDDFSRKCVETLMQDCGGSALFDERYAEINYIEIRRWILESPLEEVAELLVVPYLLMTPYEKTYCWYDLTSEKASTPKYVNAIRVFNALTSNTPFAGGGDGEAEGGESGEQLFEESAEMTALPSEDHSFKTVSEAMEFMNEAYDRTLGLEFAVNSTTVMSLFNEYIHRPRPTIMFKVRTDVEDMLRDDNRVATRRQGVKRSFARILSNTEDITAMDRFYYPKDDGGQLIMSRRGTLDYSQLFKKYSALLEEGAKKRFNYVRIVGYMISFTYDPDVENACLKLTTHGMPSGTKLFEFYSKSPDASRFHEVTTFDVLYIRGGEYGDFLFSGYTPIGSGSRLSYGDVPPEVADSGLLANFKDGLHSVMVHDFNRINMTTNYNVAVH